MKIAVVSSSFYGFYEQALLQNAIGHEANCEADILPFVKDIFSQGFLSDVIKFEDCQITTACVPGALEIPQAINWLVDNHNFDGILALGCVIKGKTTHFEHVCNETMHGITKLALKTATPITSGIVTSLTEKDTLERVTTSGKNLGRGAMASLIAMINLKKKVLL
jgi:6,7-dimethyl-8-ribityllumazine synthase